MSLNYTLAELQENFDFMDNWEDKYRYLLELGEKLPEFPEQDKTEKNKVQGCISQVWITLKTERDENGINRLYFLADSDAHIVKGLIAVLMVIYNGKTPEDVLLIDIREIFAKLGMNENISPSRRNGFFSMVQRIQTFAAGTDW
jgi:cysteine desulfuration protein SufE